MGPLLPIFVILGVLMLLMSAVIPILSEAGRRGRRNRDAITALREGPLAFARAALRWWLHHPQWMSVAIISGVAIFAVAVLVGAVD